MPLIQSSTPDCTSKPPTFSAQDTLPVVPSRGRDWWQYNHLWNFTDLRNSYFSMRHGLSESNVMRVTGSNPEFAMSAFDLVPEGYDQAKEAVCSMPFRELCDPCTVIVCSDFLRAIRTAELVAEAIGCSDVIRVEWLRERFFGEYDLFDPELYFPHLHPLDVEDPFNTSRGCESPVQLQERLSRGIVGLETAMSGKKILLVTHHDAMQMLEVVFSREYPGRYAGTPEKPRSLITNCEIRQLKLTDKSQVDQS